MLDILRNAPRALLLTLALSVISVFPATLAADGLHPRLQTYWLTQPEAGAQVWVTFRDKGLDLATEKIAVADLQRLYPPVCVQRRSRSMPPGAPLFSARDLPVAVAYIAQVEQFLGTSILGRSRWINAVAVKLNRAQAETLLAFPEVLEIVPCATYKRYEPPDEPSGTKAYPSGAPLVYATSYGPSQMQIEQLNLPALHQLGFHGAGKRVAFFDTGFFLDHPVYDSLHIIAKYDFVNRDTSVGWNMGDTADYSDSHGTATLSLAAGFWADHLIGGAHQADYLLCKTETLRSETTQEEYNWAEAAEWCDSLGVDLISSSLGYDDWWTWADYNGITSVASRMATRCDTLGILVCNSAGNSGCGTLVAPADGINILAVGAVDRSSILAGFSAGMHTPDGRTKPEILAWGVTPVHADNSRETPGVITSGSGTSYACPIAAGAATCLWQMHPTWTDDSVRAALMASGSFAEAPDSCIGWGIPDLVIASGWSGPILAAREATVNDSAGDGDGALGPDEDLTVRFRLANLGPGIANNLRFRLQPITPGVTVAADSFRLTTLAGHGVSDFYTSVIRLDHSIPSGSTVHVRIAMTCDERAFEATVAFTCLWMTSSNLLVYNLPDTSLVRAYRTLFTVDGLSFDEWNVATYGTPGQALLRSHRIVYWVVGAGRFDAISALDMERMAAYLRGGGRLWLQGTYFFLGAYTSDLAINLLHADSAGYWPFGNGQYGVADDPVSGAWAGDSLPMAYGNWGAAFRPVDPRCVPIFFGTPDSLSPPDPSDSLDHWFGLRVQDGYKAVCTSWGIEFLLHYDARNRFLHAVYTWLNDSTAVESSGKVSSARPLAFRVTPQPARDRVLIEAVGLRAAKQSLRIRDLWGRTVAELPPNDTEVRTWFAQAADGAPMPSGIYFLTVDGYPELNGTRIVLIGH